MHKPLRVIISGGGTGGHIFPAIAIANKLREREPDTEILFVGALGKMEMDKVPAAGYKIVGLPVAGLQRSLSLKNLTLPFKLWKSLRRAAQVIREFKPDVAVGVGGYASGPLLWTAAQKNIPCILQEQNSYAGITNKLLGKKAKCVCVAYEGMERFFPKEKIRLTGNPIRNTIVPSTPQLKEEAQALFQLDPKRKCILVVGGSLGARTLNQSVANYLALNEHIDVDIIWQCGSYYHEQMKLVIAKFKHPQVRLVPFIARMELAFAAADVVISRSGAGTISELCMAAKACIFVPSPNVSEDHQTHNAMALVNKGAALIATDQQAPLEVMNMAVALAQDTTAREKLEQNIATLAHPNAARDIVEEIVGQLGIRN